MNFHYGAWNVFHDMARNWLNQLTADMNAATHALFHNSFSVFLGDQNEANEHDRNHVIIEHHNPDTNIRTAVSGVLSLTEGDDGNYSRSIHFPDHDVRIDLADEHLRSSYKAVGSMMMEALTRSHAGLSASNTFKDITSPAPAKRLLSKGDQFISRALGEKQDAIRLQALKAQLADLMGPDYQDPAPEQTTPPTRHGASLHDLGKSEISLSFEECADHTPRKKGKSKKVKPGVHALRSYKPSRAPAVTPQQR